MGSGVPAAYSCDAGSHVPLQSSASGYHAGLIVEEFPGPVTFVSYVCEGLLVFVQSNFSPP